ncbi:hypothetical protein BdWA1_003479 [Babesia duncani]|uniref:Uncharacterized protein n=1 Tax=Babesia duncani TaxID=323732 RepID=A0AAD9UMX8_9APIC|nr:hypothetical protein BdWA1_003479 [Babesia duncani]
MFESNFQLNDTTTLSNTESEAVYENLIQTLSTIDQFWLHVLDHISRNIADLNEKVTRNSITTREEYERVAEKIVESKDVLAQFSQRLAVIPIIKEQITQVTARMSEARRSLGEDLKMRIKALEAGKMQLKEKLEIELETVIAKIDALPIKEKVKNKSQSSEIANQGY